MSTPSSSSFPPIHKLVFWLFPTLWIGVFIGAITNPAKTAELGGFPLPNGEPSTAFWLFAIRDLYLAVLFIALAVYGQWRAVSIALACLTILGVGDCVVEGLMSDGWVPGLQSHGPPTVLALWSSWRLAKEHF